MILIAGATSQAGRKLLPLLAEKGYRVRTLTRDPRKLESVRSLGVEVFEGDLRQPDTLLHACEGAEAVVSSVTAIGANLIQDVDEVAQCSLMATAQKCGVKRFVLVSAFGAAVNHPVDFFRMKFRVEEYLKSLNMEYTILRPTAFMESWCAQIGAQVLNGERVAIYGNGKNPINFVSAGDVAKFILPALEYPRLRNQTLTVGGPQNLTFDEVAAVYERLCNKRVGRKYSPAWLLKLSSTLYRSFDETKSRFMAMRYDLAMSNWRVDMSEVVRRYPIMLMCLEDVARQMIGDLKM